MPLDKPKHSPLGASAAERWMNCSGSIGLLAKLGLPESDEPDYTMEGTAAHEAASKCLSQGLDAWEVMGTVHENGKAVTEEMSNAIQVYLDTCRSLITPHGETIIEQHLTSKLHESMYGTVDFAHVADSLLNIVDYKHGVGIAVDVERNPQLMYYAYLVLQNYPDVRRVVLRIVQPRGFHPDGVVRRWETTAEEICEWVNTALLPAMYEAEMDGTLDAGKWCRFCPAKLVCPLLSGLFGAAMAADPARAEKLSNTQLARNYKYIEAVKFYIKALEKEVFRRNTLGDNIEGTKMVQKKANRVFKEGALELFTGKFKNEAYNDPEFKSPAEMEKISPEAKKLVAEWAYTPNTGYMVAPIEDKRPAVPMKTVQELFGDMTEALDKMNAEG